MHVLNLNKTAWEKLQSKIQGITLKCPFHVYPKDQLHNQNMGF